MPALLATSRRNNSRDGVTGLLFFNGKRFLQGIEGEAAAIERTFARIGRDERHHAMVALSDRTVTAREFGDWAMAEGGMGGAAEATLEQVRRLTARAAPDVRALFESYAALIPRIPDAHRPAV